MPPDRFRRPRRFVQGALVTAFLAFPTLSFGISEDIFDCEQQAKRHHECCGPDLDGDREEWLVCFEPDGCGEDPPPVTDPAVIDCLDGLSCEGIIDLGLCDAPSACLDVSFEGRP
ncbi:MAG: hypothetical protein AAF928_01435 [Myxococcota bacterium]